MPDSLKRIEAYAFSYNMKLVTVSFGRSLEYIGENAFQKFSALSTAIFAVTSGWKVGSSEADKDAVFVDLDNASTNATYLTATYLSKVWFR